MGKRRHTESLPLGFAGSALLHIGVIGALVAFGRMDSSRESLAQGLDAVALGPAKPGFPVPDPAEAALPIDVESPNPASDTPERDRPTLPLLRTAGRQAAPQALQRVSLVENGDSAPTKRARHALSRGPTRAAARGGPVGGETETPADRPDSNEGPPSSPSAESAAAEAGTGLGVSIRGDVHGVVVWFEGGQTLPAGRYRVAYADGCLKYSGSQGWSLNAYADGHDGWWLVGETTADRIVMLPGTVGFMVGAGGFSTFGACVAENRTQAPIDFTFGGGKLGVWLADEPYGDNVSGEGGRNPAWWLIKLTSN